MDDDYDFVVEDLDNTGEVYEVTTDTKEEITKLEVRPGALVEYKLNKDGEIKTINVGYNYEMGDLEKTANSNFIEIDDNRYVGIENAVLADNVVIFEVDFDDNDVDATIITRSSFLSEDDLKPVDVKSKNGQYTIGAYFAAFENNNKEIKAMAYTEATGSTYYYGVAVADPYNNSDYDLGIEFVGDDAVYELKGSLKVTSNDLVQYTKSGDNATATEVFKDKTELKSVEATGWSNGRLTTDERTYKTDDETIVYVMDSKGAFALGDLDSITKNAYVLVVEYDSADNNCIEMVIVDEYTNHKAIADKAAAKTVQDLIDALPAAEAVIATDETEIEAARAAYDKLTDAQKKYVDTAKLVAAEKALDAE